MIVAEQPPPERATAAIRAASRNLTVVSFETTSRRCERVPGSLSIFSSLLKLDAAWRVLSARPAYDAYIATRFDLVLSHPVDLAALRLNKSLFVALPAASKERAQPGHRFGLARSVPDFLAIGDRRSVAVWMTRLVGFQPFCELGDAVIRRGAPGMWPGFRVSLSPEAFLQRWLALHGIIAGQDVQGVELLPSENWICLVRQAHSNKSALNCTVYPRGVVR